MVEGKGVKNEIASMPGVYHMSIDEILKECEEIVNFRYKNRSFLFGIPSLKDSVGSDALSSDGIIATALRAIKDKISKFSSRHRSLLLRIPQTTVTAA